MESLRQPAPPFIRNMSLTWGDLDDTCRKLLATIQGEPSLKQLIDKHNLKAWQYTLFRQNRLIVQVDNEINLTETARGWVKRYATAQRFEAGDLVTITFIQRMVGSKGWDRSYWKADTDSGYVLNLYAEDFSALAKAGHKLPDFNTRGSVKVSMDVLVSKEQQSSGWRIAEIRPKP